VFLCGGSLCHSGFGVCGWRDWLLQTVQSSGFGFGRLVCAKPEIPILHNDNSEGNEQKNQRNLQLASLLVGTIGLRPGQLRC
jgi:hypothetical protein